MKQGLPQICLMLTLAVSMTACVTERTYTGTDIPVSQRTFDKELAARDRLNLGLTYLRKGNSVQAKFNLDKAEEYAPYLEDVHVAKAYYFQTVGEVIRAEEAYEKAISLSTATGNSYNNFGVFLCQQKKYEKSEKMFLAAINIPKYTRIGSSYENLGLCSKEAGHIEKARQYFEMALKYEPRRQSTLLELIDMEMDAQQYTMAKRQLERYHSVAQQSAQSLALAIEIEQGLNDLIAASRFGLILLAKFPQSPQALQYKTSLQQ
ncbi:type IV pilus biogenesis/stability protein PilW [Shewanella gelidii]|uniref:Type IV pilus biogenesis/stability protein PilW n=1 Tax=Shewanella gelidii TaxID=1642821 RepID=A0A917JK02_9GAMM|nr:type IV pilus biogenesis/stability protein PilW [Shewanella gelidii]MCL1096520.1 type IV pilus biogenesis/stability protein PilW [Shewanella gelidii]GGI68016.1 type IV pilus biogenesis/stability protein PilW [Shewanella gelidii]